MRPEDPVVIVAAARTPIGAFQGCFADFSATDLGGAAMRAAVERSHLSADAVTDVMMGCVLAAGLGQAPARQAALKAGLPLQAPALTINKMSGSGLAAIVLASELLAARRRGVFVAGGMESMSNAPYLLTRMRRGQRAGHGEVKDHMLLDGLEDAYVPGRLMGAFAEDTAERFAITRAAQDTFAEESLRRARRAADDGSFTGEMTIVTSETAKGTIRVARDEQPYLADAARIPHLKPAFRKDGTVTAANSSSISDGAAALVLMPESEAKARGVTPLARIVGHASHAQEPAWFTTAPLGALEKLFQQTGWQPHEVDFFEINEAFAVSTLITSAHFGLDRAKVNVHGGACALGHPLGASGARIVVTLLAAMAKYDARTGVASACTGGGEALALALERM